MRKGSISEKSMTVSTNGDGGILTPHFVVKCVRQLYMTNLVD